ncbi:MAG: Mov34/MPN/PAD-1 family protein [Defluviitaleaceae bacterium]|nr:Mov34/MPN/PAD-1 family protein [Defluviitaleaceae bacterium]
MQVIFSNRAYLAILSETSEKIKTETGGVFLGCYENGNWYVIEAIDPGPKSIFQVAYFEYDKNYTEHLINKLVQMYKAKLTLIGLWHRHPGSFDEFSSTDNGTNTEYAKLSPNGAVSVLVNVDPKFRITPYHVSMPLKYTKITYKVGDDLIPEHLLQLKNAEKSLEYINGYSNKPNVKPSFEKPKVDFIRLLEGIKDKLQRVTLSQEDYNFEEAENYRDFLIDSLLDDINYFTETRKLALNIEQNKGVLCLSHKGADNVVTKVYFMYIARDKQIVFSRGDNVCYLYTPGLFAGLLKDYVPADVSFKSGLLNALGIGKDKQGVQT